MSELLHFIIDEETSIAVEADGDPTGFATVSRGDEAGLWSDVTFTAAIGRARRAAEVTLQQFKSMVSGPDEVEIEFGVRLSAQAGAVLAKTASEGHVLVKLVWRKSAE